MNFIKLGGTTTTANGTGNATNLDSARLFYAYSSAADGLITLCTASSTDATASIRIGDEQTLLIYKEPTERVYGDGTDIHFTKVTYLSGDFN
mgnify:FL=1